MDGICLRDRTGIGLIRIYRATISKGSCEIEMSSEVSCEKNVGHSLGSGEQCRSVRAFGSHPVLPDNLRLNYVPRQTIPAP